MQLGGGARYVLRHEEETARQCPVLLELVYRQEAETRLLSALPALWDAPPAEVATEAERWTLGVEVSFMMCSYSRGVLNAVHPY